MCFVNESRSVCMYILSHTHFVERERVSLVCVCVGLCVCGWVCVCVCVCVAHKSSEDKKNKVFSLSRLSLCLGA